MFRAVCCPRWCTAVFIALSAACTGHVNAPVSLQPGGINVLFVGNSLTYTNDLPRTVASIGAANGDTVRVAMEAGPNLALIDHLNGATSAPQVLAREPWQFVVLQQGPTPPGICRDSLVLWTRLWNERIRTAGAVPALFMTWPAASGQSQFDGVRESFQQAAVAVDGVFLPAGEAWRAAWREDATLALYGPDGFHPSPLGSFLAALEIYERITGKDARSLAPRAFVGASTLSIPVATIQLLQRAAHDANTRFPARTGGTATQLAPATTRRVMRC